MKVCTISDSSTMAGHSPEPMACSRNESPSMICAHMQKDLLSSCSDRRVSDVEPAAAAASSQTHTTCQYDKRALLLSADAEVWRSHFSQLHP